ncbi:Membrane associated serine protease, rhomboid family [Tenacibaculum sp. MAR_2009_124]|uniref:rhomboid family intramembrane serine protease n=1 Tax=Tenacibaculum sp. MAR_2009_124 TaxID=1250059 RepID=UPI000899A365|nr:rhomboid family intramembrane serine protease [Tenacibaculum sp. MAR_2009_124]SEC85661.1 Membrane associated serine protease, rhomboid family [Tenacibaculum sp. MAR_2009_124]
MSEKYDLKFSDRMIMIPFIMVFVIWFVYWLEIKFGLNFNEYGLYPRSFTGLRGILFSPFIHSGVSHLFNNSIPLFVLTSILLYFYRDVSKNILIYGGIVTGTLTWIIGRESHHIGASGIVYLLFSFVFFSGILKKHFRLVAVSLVVIFLYGSMVWYVFPLKEGISWEGHLSGFIVGITLAFIFKNKGITKEEFVFSRNDFDDMFDNEGNYIPPVEETEEEIINTITYKYIYKEDPE